MIRSPKHRRGQEVWYFDNQEREQQGTILAIERTWPGWHDDPEYFYDTYTITHPTYANRKHYAGEESIGT